MPRAGTLILVPEDQSPFSRTRPAATKTTGIQEHTGARLRGVVGAIDRTVTLYRAALKARRTLLSAVRAACIGIERPAVREGDDRARAPALILVDFLSKSPRNGHAVQALGRPEAFPVPTHTRNYFSSGRVCFCIVDKGR